jgi:hypothetical protein
LATNGHNAATTFLLMCAPVAELPTQDFLRLSTWTPQTHAEDYTRVALPRLQAPKQDNKLAVLNWKYLKAHRYSQENPNAA